MNHGLTPMTARIGLLLSYPLRLAAYMLGGVGESSQSSTTDQP